MTGPRVTLAAVLAVVGAAAVHQAAVALEWIELGSTPGDDPPLASLVSAAALALFAGGAAGGWLASNPEDRVSRLLLALVAAAAAALVVARFLAFDPYYLPTRRRYSDEGFLSPLWVAVVVLLALAALGSARRLRAGMWASVVALPLAGATAIVAGAGH